MSDVERTFEALKKSEFQTVLNSLEGCVVIDPITFEPFIHQRFHSRIEGHGWDVTEFLNRFNVPW